jgi:hypothetical protein
MAKHHPRSVREPIQVYLDPDDRRLLDELAKVTGVSRAEVLRRGIRSFAAAVRGTASPMLEFLDRAAAADWPPGLAEAHDTHLADAYHQGGSGSTPR